jgi:dCTP diphosphatase
MLTAAEMDRRVNELVERFPRLVAAGTFDIGTHVKTLVRLEECGGVTGAIHDDRYVDLLRTTLREWGIGVRGSRMAELEAFKNVLSDVEPLLLGLEHVSIADPSFDVNGISSRLLDLFLGLTEIVTSRAKWVAVTKAAHHLLPQLVVPVDGWYTASFFGMADLPVMSRRSITALWARFHDLAVRADAVSFVAPGTWDSCLTKVLDNAIVGYWRLFLRPLDVPDIQRRLQAFASARDWDQFHSPKNLTMAIAGEVGELIEIFQWLDDDASRTLSDVEAARAGEEVADLLIYLLRLADQLGLSIPFEVEKKLTLNEKRYPVELARGNAVKHNRRSE